LILPTTDFGLGLVHKQQASARRASPNGSGSVAVPKMQPVQEAVKALLQALLIR